MRQATILSLVIANVLIGAAYGQVDPETAPRAMIDRFSEAAGTLFIRTDDNGLPGPNEPIDFDQGPPFITQGLGPSGGVVTYYNFDVLPTEPAPIYVLFREGEEMPVEGQLNIVDVIPGDEGYNDFWQVVQVTVPADYEANTFTGAEELADLPMEPTETLVNCPIVPEGSTATLRYTDESPELTQGWYNGAVVFYFNFSEAALMTTDDEMVPTSPIYVTFNINPDEEGGGPPSGFVTEPESAQTHNVPATLPEDAGYSPLWSVNVYDNADFDMVEDLATAQAATILGTGVALVNCPIVSVMTGTAITPEEQPAAFVLHGNYPNPFNPSTVIAYELSAAGHVQLRIYDTLGREVATLIDGRRPAGTYQAEWNGRDASGQRAPSGTYLYRLTVDGQQRTTRTMTLLK